MFARLFLLNIALVAAASAHHTVLIANKDGLHIVNPITQNHKSILQYDQGADSITYNLETGNVHAILKSQNHLDYKLMRTRTVSSKDKCIKAELPQWCHRNKLCLNACNSDNPHLPMQIKVNKCQNMGNLILDWINTNLYWTCDPKTTSPNKANSSINMVTEDGYNLSTILTSTRKIQSIDVDPFERKLFILESNVLSSTTLRGENATIIQQFDPLEVISKIALDTRNRIIYVVGQLLNSGERFLARLPYDGTDYQKLATSLDPAWQFGPKVVNNVVYWLTTSNSTEHSTAAEGDVKIEHLVVPYEVGQWSLVHVDAQRPLSGSYCSKLGCSHGCTVSTWMDVVCQCPAGMVLAADNTTCEEVVHIEVSTQEAVAKLPAQVSQNDTESTLTASDDLTHPAVNGTDDLAESAVETSQNATVTTGAVTASSSSMSLFYIVVTTMFVSFFVVVVIVRKRAKMGNYQPAGSQDRTDFSL